MRYCRAVAHERGRTGMVARRPLAGRSRTACGCVGRNLAQFGEADWLEAFRSHPRIGETGASEDRFAGSRPHGRSRSNGTLRMPASLPNCARRRESCIRARFNRIFIVCATGKSPAEILKILQRRLENDEHTELEESCGAAAADHADSSEKVASRTRMTAHFDARSGHRARATGEGRSGAFGAARAVRRLAVAGDRHAPIRTAGALSCCPRRKH